MCVHAHTREYRSVGIQTPEPSVLLQLELQMVGCWDLNSGPLLEPGVVM